MSLSYWRKTTVENCKKFPKFLYYLSSKENFESIITNGIISKNEIKKKNVNYKSFAENEVQKRRSTIDINISDRTRRNLHDLVPLYFTPKTPTLYARQNSQYNFFFSKISSIKIISDSKKNFAFTDGNAASDLTKQYWNLKNLPKLKWDIILAESWADKEDGKRIRNAEFLIHSNIEIKFISEFIVLNSDLKIKFEKILEKKNIKIPVNKDLDFSYFFQV